MESLSCPISFKNIDSYAFRLSGIFYIFLLIVFIYNENILFIVYILGDILMRLTPFNNSPILFFCSLLLKIVHAQKSLSDEAPKRFALILGSLMLLMIILSKFYTFDFFSFIVTLNLIVLKLLDVIFDYCVGCKLYQLLNISTKKGFL